MGEKFNYYDAVAHLIPGTIGSLFILYTSDLVSIGIPKIDFGPLTGVGVGVAIAYTLGHLLQSLASSLEPFYYALWGGKPSICLLERKSGLFSEHQRKKLVDDLVQFFAIEEKCPEKLSDNRNYYQRLFERCMSLCNRHKLGRVDTFSAIYGFHRVLLTTFLLGFLTYVTLWFLQHWNVLIIPSAKVPWLRSLIVLTGAAGWIEIFRARKRAYYYAREILWMTSEYIRSSGVPGGESGGQ